MNKIDAGEWPIISALLDQALDLPASQRRQWLESLPADNSAHKPTLERLLANHAHVGTQDFLSSLPRVGVVPDTLDSFDETRTIGPYRLLREIGRGGMGTVWLAERADGVLKRQVALKLPHAGLATRSFAERLARERDILASLEHPNIARLYDAGVSAEGQPYLALEYVAGEELLAYAQARSLGVRERIRLFLQVLAAVQYAHSRLVIHRDLKPANVLVDLHGSVRLLDFGIAKIMGETGQAQSTELTEISGNALTPSYSSPEQIAGKPLGTPSDVYSLGVLLFELLTGERPYRLKRGSRAELEEAIFAAEPRRPSDAAPALRRLLRGDLDAIVLKALAKAPEQRYATAEAFQGDLQRYLDGEPVQAQPERRWYRMAKFVRRHRLAFGMGLAVVMALTAALATALWQAQQARIEARTAKAVQGFLEDIFALNDRDNPDPAKARETTARQLLDRAASRIDTELVDAPEARLHTLELLAQIYGDYRVSDQAVALGRKVVALSRQQFGPQHPRVAQALAELAEAMSRYPRSRDEKLAALDEAAAILERHGDGERALKALVQRRLANFWTGQDNHKALAYAEAAVTFSRPAGDAFDLSQALMTLGLVHEALGQLPRAEQALAEAGTVLTSSMPAAATLRVKQMVYLSGVQQSLHHEAQAEAQLRGAFALASTRIGEDHADTIQTEYRLGNFLAATGRLQEALAVLQSAQARVQRSGLGETYTALVLGSRGAVLARLGRLEEGVQALQQRAEAYELRGRDSASHAQLLGRLALTQVELGLFETARAGLDRAAAIFARTDPSRSAKEQAVAADITARIAERRLDEAVQVLQRHDSTTPAAVDAGMPEDFELTLARAQLALARGELDSALDQARGLRASAVALRPYAAETEMHAALVEGQALRGAGRCAEAVQPLARAAGLAAEIYDKGVSPQLADAQVALADCEFTLGDSGQALKLAREARVVIATHARLGPQHRQPLAQLEERLKTAAR
jgi:tetratricopeptide (TPR) repeat protein